MGKDRSTDEFSNEEVVRRMNAAVRRALNTPPSPTKELVGKTKRAQARRDGRSQKSSSNKAKIALTLALARMNLASRLRRTRLTISQALACRALNRKPSALRVVNAKCDPV